MNRLFKDTSLLSFTMFLSKLLGLIYIIPFTALVGTSGYILYEYAYKPYAIMLSIATMGIPMAVSKFVSKYNELGDYRTSHKLFKSGLIIMTITGVFWFAVLNLSAEVIAKGLLGTTSGNGSSVEDVVFVLRCVSFALIIVPIMALIRGYFQGNQIMSPTGISQVTEQFARIIVIVGMSYAIIELGYFGGELRTAIGWATFAATIGAFVSLLNLLYYFKKYKAHFDEQKEKIRLHTVEKTSKSLLSIYKEIIFIAIPFVIVGLAIPIYQNIDIFTINHGLMSIGYSLKDAEYVNSIIAITSKMVTMPIIIANAFALTLIPLITQSYVSKDLKTMQTHITKTLQTILFATLPFAAFFLILSAESYASMFGTRDMLMGGEITKAYALISLFFCLFVVTASILQGIDKQYFTVVALFIGILVKVSTAYPFIHYFEGTGTALSTMAGFLVSILINLYVIKKEVKISARFLVKQTLKVISYSLVTLLVMWLVKFGLMQSDFFTKEGYMVHFLLTVIVGGIGASIYLLITYKTGDLKKLLSKDVK